MKLVIFFAFLSLMQSGFAMRRDYANLPATSHAWLLHELGGKHSEWGVYSHVLTSVQPMDPASAKGHVAAIAEMPETQAVIIRDPIGLDGLLIAMPIWFNHLEARQSISPQTLRQPGDPWVFMTIDRYGRPDQVWSYAQSIGPSSYSLLDRFLQDANTGSLAELASRARR